MAYIDNVKPWFETGDFPTQAQFYQMFEWLRWRDQPLAIADITNLTSILNELASPVEAFITTGADFQYTIPLGFLMEKIVVKPFSNCSPFASIEDSDVDDVFLSLIPDDPDTIMKPSGKCFSIDEPALIKTREIIIYNLPPGSKVILIKRKIA